MTELEDHAGTIIGGMHQRREWTSSLWSAGPDWARRATIQAQALMVEAQAVQASEGARDIAARVLAGMYGGTEVGGWPQVASQAVDWARYALRQAQFVLLADGDGRG